MAQGSGSNGAHGSGRAELGHRVATGFVYMLVQTLGVRMVRFGGSLVLAWLLIPDDFALFGLTVTLYQFVSVLKNAGLRDVLISRQARMRKWVNPAVWLSVALGSVGALVILLGAPALAWFFSRQELIPLATVLAGATFFTSLGQVPLAILHAQLRFKLGSTIEAANSSLVMLLTIYFAWCGLGAMSFVLPLLLVSLLQAAIVWRIIRPEVRLDPQWRRWKYLAGDSFRLIGADIARTIAFQGDYIVLGRAFVNNPVVGHYFYAFQISSQSIALLSQNVEVILFPALSSIREDTARHQRAFASALRMLAIVGFPFCLLQAAVAEPLINAIFPERFHPALPFVVILSIGMVPRLLIPPCSAMIRSQGRFGTFTRLSWLLAFLVVSLAIVGAMLGSVQGVAIGVSASFFCVGIAYSFAALHGAPVRKLRVIRITASPLIVGGVACGLGYAGARLLPSGSVGLEFLRVLVTVLISAAVYIPIIMIVEREPTREIVSRMSRVLRRRSPTRDA